MALIVRSTVIIIFGFIDLFLAIGFGASSGLFYSDWRTSFEDDSQEVIALATSLNSGLYLGTGPLAAAICEQMGFRFGIIFGGVLTSVGAMATAFSKNTLHLALSFGVIMGIGEALILVAIISLVALHNPERTRRATSIVYVGVSAGTGVFPIFYKALSEIYAWQGSLFIYSAVLLNVCAIAAVNIEPPSTEMQLEISSPEVNLGSTKPKKKATWLQKVCCLLRRPEILLLVLIEFFWNFGSAIVLILAPEYSKIAANSNVTFLVSFIGYGGLTGRLLASTFEFIPFYRKIPSWLLFSLAISLCAVPIVIYPFGTSTIFFACCIFTVGLFNGMAVCCQTATFAEFVSRDLLIIMIGFVYLFDGLGYLVGPPLVIAVTKVTGKTEHMFFIAAASLAGSGIALITIALLRKRKAQNLKEKPMNLRDCSTIT